MARPPLEFDRNELLLEADDFAGDGLSGAGSGGDAAALADVSDHHLQERIQRVLKTILSGFTAKLPDRGVKLRSSLQQMQAELDRRSKENRECDTSGGSKLEESSCALEVSSSKSTTSKSHLEPPFALRFSCKIETKVKVKAKTLKQRRIAMHDDVKHQKLFAEPAKIFSGQSIQSTGSFARDDEKGICDDDFRAIHNSTISFHGGGNVSSQYSKRRRASESGFSSDSKLKKVDQLVLLDDEDVQPVHTIQGDGPNGRKEAKIYYPSRNDPEAVELSYADLNCLEPESYLSSPMMNFYIQYLQRALSRVARPRGEYYFFNTYFYSKLEEAVSCKVDRSASFLRLRRWWKGVNIFQKSYIFLPIHRDMHWSLVIICIPTKEDGTGPIILHLDSLGLHNTNLIFDVVGSYLKEEWRYLNENAFPLDLAIPERVWRHLPRKIEKKRITVPQQKNEYDCGLFVLYFMERFIEDAPEILRMEDIAKTFGSKWFEPADASGLRERIRHLLIKEFENAIQDEDDV